MNELNDQRSTRWKSPSERTRELLDEIDIVKNVKGLSERLEIGKIEAEIAYRKGKYNAIKDRFGFESHEAEAAKKSLNTFQAISYRLVPQEYRPQIEKVYPLPYKTKPPKKNLKGLDSLMFDWTGYDDLKRLIEVGNFETWDQQILQLAIDRGQLNERRKTVSVKRQIKCIDRQIEAFQTVVNHLKNANGLLTNDVLDPETEKLIEQAANKESDLRYLLEEYGRDNSEVKTVSKSLDELREKLREITHGVEGEDGTSEQQSQP